MSLSDDLAKITRMAIELSERNDPEYALAALDILASIMPDILERARALEGTNVPPHWRRQPWDGQPRDNVTPLRRGDA